MRWTVLLLVGLAACEKTASQPPPATPASAPTPAPAAREVQLPGLRVALPDWPVAQRDESFAGGVYRTERAPGAEQIQIGWVEDAGGPLPPERMIARTIEGMKAAGLEVEVVGSHADAVHDHAGTTFELRSTAGAGFRALVTFWYCPRDRRAVQVRSILLPEPAHARLIRSIRCHAGGQARPAGPRFARFDAPGFTRSAERPDRLVYTGPAGSVILLPGMAGAFGRVAVADGAEGRDFRAKLLSLLVAAWTQERPAATHFARQFARVPLTVEGLPSVAAVTAVHCRALDAAFPVAFLGPAATPEPEIVRILSAASCPE